MQTALHIYALVAELKDKLIGAEFIDTEFYKKEREGYCLFKPNKGTLALGIGYHPVGFGTFLIPAGKIEVKTREKPWPFFQQAYGSIVHDISQFGFDRIFHIDLKKDNYSYSIAIEAIGPNGNFWLLDKENKVIATLRNKKYDPEKPYSPPPTPEKPDLITISDQSLNSICEEGARPIGQILHKAVIGLDKYLAEEIITRVAIDPNTLCGELTDQDLKNLINGCRDMVKLFSDYSKGYMYDTPVGSQVYPIKLKSLGEPENKYKSLSLAVYDLVRQKKSAKKKESEKQQIIDAVKRHYKRLQKKVKKIEGDLSRAHNFDQYKKMAEVLKINLPDIKKGQEEVVFEDPYIPGEKLTIKLDPSLTPAQNADEYFKKYRKGREGLELLKRRLQIAQSELKSAEEMKEEIETDYESAVEKYESEIKEILPGEGGGKAAEIRLPYREHTLSTGAKIFVGKDGADNDETTFHHAKKYELWFHTAQCPGSHVILKYPDKNFEPSRQEIEETAAIAAYHSKARHSKAVPVIYTERKYVRKPRKAKPGLVTVEREKMVMVEPLKPEK